MLKTKIQGELKELKELLKFILPKGRTEGMIFISFMIFYISYSQRLVFHTFILDFPAYVDPLTKIHMRFVDGYFSFDNIGYYHKGYQTKVPHPLIIIFFKPLMVIGTLLVDIFQSEKAKSIFIVFTMASLISMSLVYTFRYLRKIIEIKSSIAVGIVIFFGLFATNLILCFTFESFTVTCFLLTMLVCYYGLKSKNKQQESFISFLFFSIALGGITITNYVKGFVPLLFTTVKYRQKILWVCLISLFFGGAIALDAFYLNIGGLHSGGLDEYVKDYHIHRTTFSDTKEFSDSKFEQIVYSFWGSPILMSEYKLGTATLRDRSHTILLHDVYRHWWQYAFVIPLLALLCVSIIRNLKNKYVQLLLLLFGVDIFIHLILDFGISEGFFIYGGHWVYIVPLLLGWLYKSLKNKTQQRIFIGTMSVLLVVLATNNLVMLKEFIGFASEYFATDEWNMIETVSPQ